MDPKKQELNPELKEIYDRVMNTQVKSEAQPQSAPSQPPPQAPAAPPGTVWNPAPPPPLAGQNPLGGATAEAKRDPFFSPPPQRSITDTKPFVFTGNKVTTPQEPNTSQSQTYIDKKISKPIIAVLVVVLIVVWALFWAKFFGLF